MAVDPNMLRNSLQQTLSPEAETRKAAEKFLETVAAQPGFVVVILQLLESNTERPEVRLAAALLFKNFIKRNWDPEKEKTVAQADREVVKQHIVELMCRMPDAIQKQLIEALVTVGEYDFPDNWPALLPQLVQKLHTEQDWKVRNGVLLTANTLFKRFRHVFRSDSLYAELKTCLEAFQEPLLVLFKQTGVALRTPGVPKDQQVLMVGALRIMSRIFFSLNWQDLPEYFEDHIQEWMAEFLSYFSYTNPALVDEDNEDEPDPIDALLVGIAENVNLYADKYDEEFKPYLTEFTSVFWNLLANKVTLQPKHDELAARCMKFLTSVSSKAIHREVFSSQEVLTQICGIVVKNLQLRSSDEELFEDNPMDYIRRDVEGSDGDSRRSAARDLIRGLLNTFSEEVTQITMAAIQTQLQQYRQDPATNWTLKDVSINLVIAISALKQSRLRGVSEVNARVPLMDFFMAEVFPELSNAHVNPILKADAIKFVSTFRNQMPVEAMDQLFPLLLNSLEPSQFVVHTYAAACLERLLTVKDDGVLRFSSARLNQYLSKLLDHLFNILEGPNYPENDYLMRLVMRLITVSKQEILPLANVVVDRLTRILNRICANPSNPTFSHFLFEALSALILNVCTANSAATENFEALLFPPFQKVLTNDVEALSPYVYQVLAQMLELRPSGVSAAYMSLFPVLLNPMVWERVSNASAIVKLLEAYMRKAPQDVSKSVPGILGVFQKLISSRATETNAFSLLRGFFAFMPLASYQNFLNEIVKILMIRLQSRMAGRSPGAYVVELIYTISVLIGKFGPDLFIGALEALQPGMSKMFTETVWLANVTKIRGRNEKKATVVGLTRLLCESEFCLSQEAVWKSVLEATVNVLEDVEDATSTVKDVDDALVDLEQTGYEAGFSKLHFASVVPTDTLSEYPVPKNYFATSLSKLASSRPGVYSSYAVQISSPRLMGALESYFRQYNLSFP